MEKRPKNIDIIMLSGMGSNEGGREAWVYNFLPLFIKKTSYNFRLIGYRFLDEPDNTKCLQQSLFHGSERVKVKVLSSLRRRIPKFLCMRKALKSYLNSSLEEPRDLVVCMGLFELLIVRNLRQFKHAKKIVWLRGIFLHEKFEKIPLFLHPVFKWIERRQLEGCDIVLANGADIRDFYENLYGIDIKVIENGVDVNKWDNKLVESRKLLRIAYVGRLSKEKGLDYFLKLVEVMKSSEIGDDLDFHIVGAGDYRIEEVITLVQAGWLTFHNSISNSRMVHFLQDMDVCVAFTLAGNMIGGGGTSNALFEQMACRKVIVAWDNRIFRQVLNEENSFMVQERNIDELKDKIDFIYHNRAISITRAQNARKSIKRFSMDTQVEKLRKVIDL